MTRTRAFLALPLLALGLLAAAPAVAAPEDREVKEARKDLRKNARKLEKIVAALEETKKEFKTTFYKDEEKRRGLKEQVDRLRGLALETVSEVARANNEKAAEFLVAFGLGVRDHEIYEEAFDELSRLTDEEAVGWMAEVLRGNLSEDEDDGGRRRRRRGRDGDNAWQARVLVARAFELMEGEPIAPALALVIKKGTQPNVVNQAVRSSANKKDRRIVGALIDLLGRVEAKGGWEYHQVRTVLTGLTGEDYFTHEKWSQWWEPKKDSYDFQERGEATETRTRERGPQEEVPTFFGSEIESNRLCFVIDTSGSMEMTDQPAGSDLTEEQFRALNPSDPEVKKLQRIERAKAQASAAIKSLLPTQSFNVISYSGGVRRWQQAAVPANAANKQAALEFIGSLVADGGTYTDDALEAAFEDPSIDTIYLLSDGAPYKKVASPPKDNPDPDHPVSSEEQRLFAQELIDEILDWVRFTNRFRNVKIYTFSMDGPGVWHDKWPQPRPLTLPTDGEWLSVLRNFMQDLARVTGGECKSI